MIVGSTSFFKSIPGFKSKDIDVLELIDNPIGFTFVRQFKFMSKCVFQWKRMSADEFINITLDRDIPMEMGKFLVKEFIDETKLTIEQLKRLQPLVEKLDDKHLYEKIIYDSYIINNDFYLTDQQLHLAYKEYIKYRTQ